MALSPDPAIVPKRRKKQKFQCPRPEGDEPWGIGEVFIVSGGLIDAGVVYLESVQTVLNLNAVEGTVVFGSAIVRPANLQVQILCGGTIHTVNVTLR